MVGGKRGLYLVSNCDFFWEYTYHPKEVIDGWDHLMHAIELGSEVAQSSSILT